MAQDACRTEPLLGCGMRQDPPLKNFFDFIEAKCRGVNKKVYVRI